MSATPLSLNLSPARIYVLWHPGLDDQEECQDRGLKLARRLYHWFRMENMEGIPVYFRTAPASTQSKAPIEIKADKGVRNYIIPLVEANMVACPHWRKYLAGYATLDPTANPNLPPPAAGDPEFRILPVALESVAYNLPESMRGLNFIRHMPGADGRMPDDIRLIAKLTEVLCRDLRHWIADKNQPGQNLSQAPAVPEKIKIFLSHAKADDTDEALEIKDYIQRETQCEAFFDETDIASGHNFSKVLENAITAESAGLIVLQGDNYADRPWCRKEIRDFLKPLDVSDPNTPDQLQYFIPPVIVVQTMKGRQIARTIAELGYSPCVRWQSGPETARFVVTTLLREILFGLFCRVLARRIGRQKTASSKKSNQNSTLLINRAPDPVMINRILKDLPPKKKRAIPSTSSPLWCIHPGYGLSAMEAEGLKTAVSGVEFTTFLDRTARDQPAIPDLTGKIISLSVGNAGDLLDRGYSDEHTREMLLRLLRPLLRAQTSILYAGLLPESLRPDQPWNESLNFTGTFLNLLLTERATTPTSGHAAPRLYVPKTWSPQRTISAAAVAQWSDICTFVDVPAAAAGFNPKDIKPKPVFPPVDIDLDLLTEDEIRQLKKDHAESTKRHSLELLVLQTRALSAMRREICAAPDSRNNSEPLTCTYPDDPTEHPVSTFAHILIGGKLLGFTGIMPGLFEEFLHAVEAKKPIYLIGAYGGAAALLVSWLIKPPARRPHELTVEYYKDHGKGYKEVLAELEKLPASTPHRIDPQEALDRLWAHVKPSNHPERLRSLLNNQLDHDSNLLLLKSDRSGDICRAVWNGVAKIPSNQPSA